jgi:two-component system, NarL family, response regulator DevR
VSVALASGPARPVRILICDDHEVVRQGVRALLSRRPGLLVVAEASTAAQAIAAASRERPDVVIMDIHLPDGSGIEACREIRQIHPAARVVMLTSHTDDEALSASVLAGAAGYVLKNSRSAAVEAVAAGDSLLDPGATGRVLAELRRARGDAASAVRTLTDSERLVFDRLATGKTNREIANGLGLSEKTVKNYVSKILEKLGFRRRTEATVYSVLRGRR